MKAIWKAVLLIVLLIIVAYLIAITAGMAAPAFWASVGGAFTALGVWGTIGVVVGIAYLIDPEEVVEFAEEMVEDFFTIAGAGVAALADLLLGNPLVWLAIGVGVIVLVGKKKKDEDDQPRAARKPSTAAAAALPKGVA